MLGQEDSVLLEEKEGAAPAEDRKIKPEGVPKPSEESVQDDSQLSQLEIDDNTLDDCELKQDDSEKPMDQKDFPGDDVEKTLTEDDEIPAANIARIDNEVGEHVRAEATFKSKEPVSEKTDTGDEPIDDANVKKSEEESRDMDMLSTLASAALEKGPESPGTVDKSASEITKSDPDKHLKAEATFKSEEPLSEKTDTGDDAKVKKEEESPGMASAALKKDPKFTGTVDKSASEITKSDPDKHLKAEATFKSEEPLSEKTDTGDDAKVKKEEESPGMASAALKKDPKSPGKTQDNSAGQIPKSDRDPLKNKDEPRLYANVFHQEITVISDYVVIPEGKEDNDLPSDSPFKVGRFYKFRVDQFGKGSWCDVALLKKPRWPGFPGAPSAIKISKSPDGAHLSWEPSGVASGDIREYAVDMAVRKASQCSKPVRPNQTELEFIRVFCGPANKCFVPTNILEAAHINITNDPDITFRIAARNSKGYGPGTQVKWFHTK